MTAHFHFFSIYSSRVILTTYLVLTPTEAWIVTEFAKNGSLNDFAFKLEDSLIERRSPVYGVSFPKEDGDDPLLKIIRHIMLGILEDIATGIAYIHKQLCFIITSRF